MTDKELRKLSRLELLELLLEASKENERLRDEIEALESENEAAQKLRTLSETALQLENALRYASTLTEALKEMPKKTACVSGENVSGEKTKKTGSPSDADIYGRIMGFYSKNPDSLQHLPERLRKDVSERIKEILDKLNK